jgi:putative transposase
MTEQILQPNQIHDTNDETTPTKKDDSIIKTFQYRLLPTEQQSEVFEHFCKGNRFIYNWGLAQVKEAFDKKEKFGSFFFVLCGKLKEFKKQEETRWLSTVHSQMLQESIKDLDRSLKEFFKRKKKNVLYGFPKWKNRFHNSSFRYNQHVRVEDNKVFLPKIGWVNFIKSRNIEGTIKQATVKKLGRNWYINICCNIPRSSPEIGRAHV